MRRKLNWMFVALVVLTFGTAARADTITHGSTTINMDFVTVGNAGNAADTPDHSGNPAGQGAVAYSYQIGKYEVTAGQYTAFLNSVAGVDTHALYNTSMSNTTTGSGITRSGGGTILDPYTYSVNAAFTNRPVNYVGFWDAARFANWLQSGDTESGAYHNVGDQALFGRNPGAKFVIPSEDEWYKASYYKGGGTNAGYWDYPTRHNIDTPPGQDMADASGNNANYYTAPYAYPIDIDSGKYTTVVGEFQNSPSAYGTFDQGGNVWEWNESVLYSSSRGLRGGSFTNSHVEYLRASTRGNLDPTTEIMSTGFRVASVPEPAGITLLVCGAIAGLMCWRRWR